MPTCFFAIVTKNEIRDRLRDLKAAKKLSILRPEVKLGDIVEAGSGHIGLWQMASPCHPGATV